MRGTVDATPVTAGQSAVTEERRLQSQANPRTRRLAIADAALSMLRAALPAWRSAFPRLRGFRRAAAAAHIALTRAFVTKRTHCTLWVHGLAARR